MNLGVFPNSLTSSWEEDGKNCPAMALRAEGAVLWPSWETHAHSRKNHRVLQPKELPPLKGERSGPS